MTVYMNLMKMTLKKLMLYKVNLNEDVLIIYKAGKEEENSSFFIAITKISQENLEKHLTIYRLCDIVLISTKRQ